ncbi:MAG: hypothetical protein DPW14_13090 [Planctomycetes bacterium]|nr:hypothetical protein [Planctomycetota bacterium]
MKNGKSFAAQLDGWADEDLKNLWKILTNEDLDDAPLVSAFEEKVKWLYYSWAIEKIKEGGGSAIGWIIERITGKPPSKVMSADEIPVPSYQDLAVGAAKHLGVFVKEATVQRLLLYVAHSVVITSVQKMSPEQRVKFFEQQSDATSMAENGGVKGQSWLGPVTTFGALGVAQASGFGIYMASTTALGFLTHAVGITLPFVAYTALSSTIAFVIGPAGWLGAAAWVGWKLTATDWQKLIPALLYVEMVNNRVQRR